MKTRFLALAALVLGLASCQTEPEGLNVNTGGEVDATITVSIPETETRAGGNNSAGSIFDNVDLGTEDDNKTMRYILKVYDANNNASENRQVAYSDGKTVNFDVRLVPNRHYSFVVWADYVESKDDTDFHYNTSDLTNITLKGEWNPMDETRDAFTGVYNTAEEDDKSKYNGSKVINITLTRPFAKLRVKTTDIKELTDLHITPAYATVEYKTEYRPAFNALVGEATAKGSEKKTHTTVFPVATYTNESADLHNRTLFTDYFFANEGDAVSFVLDVYEDEQMQHLIKSNDFNTDIAVNRNYLTTIQGNILTDGNNIKVDVQDAFENGSEWNPADDKYDVEVWDGESMVAPLDKNNDNIYEIERPSELAWLAAAVNGTLETRAAAADSFAGKTFVLTQNIDLGGEAWTPIGSNGNIFKGTFDGQNHVVANLVVRGGNNSDQGLFGQTHDGEIKNLVVENAKVSGRLNVGVVAGQPYTSKYTNITVQGHVEVNGMAYVGGVGGKNAYADWTNVTVNVDETSYVKANSVENGTAYRTYVGGVVGFNGEGGHSFKNITSNINVMGSTCDVGGLFGIAHYGNQFVNCSCSGNVTITTDEVENALEMGGLAGVWHNGGENVVFTNYSFTGNLYTPNITEGVNFYYGGLVGNPYSATGNGKLILDGKQYVANAAQLQAAVDAATGETTLYLGYDIVGDVTVVQKPGVKITIDGEEDKKFNGSIKVHSNSNYYADAALTIKNVKFETSAASVNVIEALENGSARYSTNITVEDCTFTATGDAVNTSVGVQVKATRGVTVKNCTATNMHSLIQAQSCDTGDVKVIDCTVNGKNGVAFKQVKAATVEGTTITAAEYGIRFDGNIDNYGIVVKNNNVTAVQPFIVRKMTGKDNTITLEGTNTLTTEAEYQIVITNGSDDAEYVKPTGTYTLTGADAYTVFPTAFPVASWDEFTAALAAGEDWIKVTQNITYEGSSSYNLKKDVVVELNGKTFTTGNASTTWLNIMGSKVTFKDGTIEGKVYVQKNGGTYSDATFENVTFGGTITFSSVTQGSLAVQGGNSVYAKKCTFKGKGSSTPNVVSLEGSSSGSVIFEDCTFNSSMNRFYANPIGGTAVFKLINCSFNKAAVVETNANWDFVNNMTITGSKSLGVNLYIAKAKDSLTDAEKAVLDAFKKNNKGTVYCASVKY